MTDPKPMSTDQKTQTLRRLFEAYKLKDRKTVEQLLTDTFTSISPYDDAINRVPKLQAIGAQAKQILCNKLIDHRQYITKHGEDMPEILNWQWTY